MLKANVLNLMRSSKNEDEWNTNCYVVKTACKGYPDFWHKEVIASGLRDEVLGAGSSDIKIQTF